MEENKINAFADGGIVYIHATNFEDFKQTIEVAEKEAQQLNDTIARLNNFKFEFKFILDKKEK